MKEIIKKRLQSHFLINSWSITDIIQKLWCIQSQDTKQASRVIADRTSGIIYNDFIQAIKNKEIIRTRSMRGTLHYVDPRYVYIFLEQCASKTLSGFKKRREFLWISEEQAKQALNLIVESLKNHKILTRSQIKQLLIDNNLHKEWQRVYHLTCYAGTLWIICFGPPVDKEDTFVLLSERFPQTQKYTKEDSLTIIVYIYFSWHGPATIEDLCWWTWLSKTEAKVWLQQLWKKLQTIEYQWKIYYHTVDNHNLLNKNWIKLLWGFDEYFLWYKDRSIVADIAHYDKMFSKNGIFSPLIIKDGKVIWIRKREFKKDKCIFTILSLPWHTITKNDLELEARKYIRFWWHKTYEIILNN